MQSGYRDRHFSFLPWKKKTESRQQQFNSHIQTNSHANPLVDGLKTKLVVVIISAITCVNLIETEPNTVCTIEITHTNDTFSMLMITVLLFFFGECFIKRLSEARIIQKVYIFFSWYFFSFSLSFVSTKFRAHFKYNVLLILLLLLLLLYNLQFNFNG